MFKVLFLKYLQITLVIFVFSGLEAQPDPRYSPFDWVNYRNPGHIQSFSEGFTYTYIATSEGGIYRYNLYANRFEESITRAQGLSSNKLFGVHFDKITGILWVISKNGIEYSNSREGDWNLISWNNLGVKNIPYDVRIGSSQNFIWIQIGTTYFKIDHISGIMLEMSAHPGESKIDWSSRKISSFGDEKDILMDYTIHDGWLYDLDRFMNSDGNYEEILTIYQGDQFQNLWVGTDKGTVLIGSRRTKFLNPYRIGIGNTDVTAIIPGDWFWLGGRNNWSTRGITRWDPDRRIAEYHDFDSKINFNQQSIFSGSRLGNEIWFGTDQGIAAFDINDQYWRQLSINKGIPEGIILSITGDTSFVWLGSTKGLRKINFKTKQHEFDPIEEYFEMQFINDIVVNNNGLWIATDFSLGRYDLINSRYLAFDQKDYLDSKEYSPTSHFWKFGINKDDIYIGSQEGIFRFNPMGSKWKQVITPAFYGGKKINDLKFIDQYCFISTNEGFIIVDIEKDWHRSYNYPFIGKVFTIIPENEIIWLGTDQGIIKFFWRKDVP